MEVKSTDKLVNFCGGCNNQVDLHKYVMVDEGESIQSSWEKRFNDERTRFLGFCLCGIWIFEEKENKK